MIHFECWYCGRSYLVAERRTGERLVCGCGHRIRIPKRSGGNCRDRTLSDWLIECVVYGGGGGLLGFLLALLAITRIPFLSRATGGRNLLLVCTLVGFLLGTLTGEAGINWIGRLIRRT